MCDHTRNKTTRDNCIQGDIDVTSIEENITKDRLKWLDTCRGEKANKVTNINSRLCVLYSCQKG